MYLKNKNKKGMQLKQNKIRQIHEISYKKKLKNQYANHKY